MAATDAETREVFVSASDGTRLFARDSGAIDGRHIPLLCLPGLTRNSKDFDPVVEQWAGKRRVIAMDFRGRGRSAYAADAMTYTPLNELADVILLLDHLRIARAAVLGTSRGGIVGMLMAQLRPQRLGGLCLNDIAPVIEPEGLRRILGYVGKQASFADWVQAANALAQTAPGFAHVSDAQWLVAAKRVFTERDSAIVPDYDINIGATLSNTADTKQNQNNDLWALLPALAQLPVALLRGAGSDLLSRETAQRFKSMVPELDWTEVPDRGHVPFLDEPECDAALVRWLDRVDSAEKSR